MNGLSPRFSQRISRVQLAGMGLTTGILLTYGAWAGCQSKTIPTESPRATAQGTLELEITSAPDPWSYLEQGRTVVEGVISTQLGLDPERPCIVTVRDIVSGFQTEVIVNPSVTGIHPHSVVPLSGGQFRIDAVNDFAIEDDGYKVLALAFYEQGGGQIHWRVPVEAGPLWPEVARAAVATARRNFGVRLLPVLSQYRRFLQIVQEKGGLPGFSDEALLFDLHVTALLEEIYTDALIVHSDLSEWERIGQDLERRYTDLLEIGQPIGPAEQAYRSWLTSTITDQANSLMTIFQEVETRQLWWGGPGDPGAVPASSLWELAKLRHVFSTAVVEETDTTLLYTANIYVDEGLMHHPCCDEPPPYVPPVPDTWQQTAPVFSLIVRLEDTDEDDVFDQFTCTGSAHGVSLETLGEEDPLQFNGHLLTPLRNLVFCDFWDPFLNPY